MKHLLSLADVGPDNLARLVTDSIDIASGRADHQKPLAGKAVGIFFRATSTRTRTAFTVGAQRLGASTIAYGPGDLQIATGETYQDTGRVLSGLLDALVIRTNGALDEMKALASQNKMAVINAMSENEHPTQGIADLVTIQEAMGRLQGVHVLYLGEGNNTAAALALAISMTPKMRLTLMTPQGYEVQSGIIETACEFARASRTVIEPRHKMSDLPRDVDVVYTTRWQTMGVLRSDPDWRVRFKPYGVTKELMAQVSKPSGTIFLHDLPAVRGEEVTDEVLDGPQSRVLRQAQHKMTSAMALLSWCTANEPPG